MQQEKNVMEAQATKKVAKKIKTVLIYLVTVLTAVTFLLHIFLPNSAPSLIGIKSDRKANNSQIELTKDSIVSLSPQLTGLQLQLKNLEAKKVELNGIYKTKKEKAKISGYLSWHKFLWHFGIGLVILALSIYLLCTINLYEGANKKAARFAAMCAITISGYYMAWIFFPYDDLPRATYFTILVSIGVLSSIAAYWITKIKYQSRQHLILTIRNLFSFIYTEVDEKEFISPDKVNDFKKRRVELVNKAVDNE